MNNGIYGINVISRIGPTKAGIKYCLFCPKNIISFSVIINERRYWVNSNHKTKVQQK